MREEQFVFLSWVRGVAPARSSSFVPRRAVCSPCFLCCPPPELKICLPLLLQPPPTLQPKGFLFPTSCPCWVPSSVPMPHVLSVLLKINPRALYLWRFLKTIHLYREPCGGSNYNRYGKLSAYITDKLSTNRVQSRHTSFIFPVNYSNTHMPQ